MVNLLALFLGQFSLYYEHDTDIVYYFPKTIKCISNIQQHDVAAKKDGAHHTIKEFKVGQSMIKSASTTFVLIEGD